MYDALIIADEILKIAKLKDKALTPMQLMKLTYIAHGWALALLDRGLFSNRIEAWKYGPVIPDLYLATKSYGRNTIPIEEIGDPIEVKVSQDDRAFLESVYDQYAHMDGIRLSFFTHKPGTPWDQVFVPNIMGIEIPDRVIEQHYRELLRAQKVA